MDMKILDIVNMTIMNEIVNLCVRAMVMKYSQKFTFLRTK